MGATPLYSLPWPELGTTADGPAGMQALATATEATISRQTTWYNRRTSQQDATPSNWIDGATVTIPSAPAADYLFTGITYWWAGNQDNASVYTWQRWLVNGAEYDAMTVGGTSGYSDRPWCAVLQRYHTHAGGALTVKTSIGFASIGVRVYPGCTVSVQRVTN